MRESSAEKFHCSLVGICNRIRTKRIFHTLRTALSTGNLAAPYRYRRNSPCYTHQPPCMAEQDQVVRGGKR